LIRRLKNNNDFTLQQFTHNLEHEEHKAPAT
jgi:hypothetical protein